jgi:hypothetical protein
MDLRSWRGRFWFGLTVGASVSIVRLIGPKYIDPLPMWLKVVVAITGAVLIATVAIYSRRRPRQANSL